MFNPVKRELNTNTPLCLNVSEEKMRIGREEVVEEVKRLLWLAVPLFSVGILQYILQAISVMFIGHLGTLPLSGASMASSFASATGFNLLLGLATALDTFCGQSNGAGQYHMLGIHMQRSMLVVLMMSVFLSIILMCIMTRGGNRDLMKTKGKKGF